MRIIFVGQYNGSDRQPIDSSTEPGKMIEVYPRVLEHGGRKPDQTIQPYQFNEDASKRTCLWLKNLPKLKPTGYYPPRIVDGKKRWSNQTDSGQNKLPPSDNRAELRSKTYPGIAKAMAEQWTPILNGFEKTEAGGQKNI